MREVIVESSMQDLFRRGHAAVLQEVSHHLARVSRDHRHLHLFFGDGFGTTANRLPLHVPKDDRRHWEAILFEFLPESAKDRSINTIGKEIWALVLFEIIINTYFLLFSNRHSAVHMGGYHFPQPRFRNLTQKRLLNIKLKNIAFRND